MTKTEKACYESITPVVNLFWVPANWFVAALNEAVEDGFLTNHSGNKLIMEVYQLFTDTHLYARYSTVSSYGSICFFLRQKFIVTYRLFLLGIFRF